jgi:hypothetical protein
MEPLELPLQNARTNAGAKAARRPIATIAAVILALAAATGTAAARADDPPTPPVMSTAEPTTAVEAYDLGHALLLAGDIKGAEAAFKKSGQLAAKLGIDFAPPHEGLAWVYLKKKKLTEADFEATTATELDPTWLRGWLVRGKVAEFEENDEMALVWYERGLTFDATDEELGAAAKDLLLRLNRPQGAKALEERQREARRERDRARAARPAMPGAIAVPSDSAAGAVGAGGTSATAAGGPEALARRRLEPFLGEDLAAATPALLAVFSQETLTRGALAVLITGNGQGSLAKALDGEAGVVDGAFRTPKDVAGRPEAYWINRALSLDLMTKLPDGTFRPDEPVTRQTLALWAEEMIARLRGNSKVFKLYRDTESPFSDVKATHYAYNAARIVVDLGMVTPTDGAFEPDRRVTMDEGVAAVSRFVPALAGTER